MNHLGTAIVVALLAAGLAWPAAAQGSKAMLKDKNGKDVGVVELMQTPAGVLLKVAGTAILIHANKDDYKSDPAGNAGDRIACGVIG